MLGTTHIEIDVLPVSNRFFREIGLVVGRIHIAQVVSAASREAGHCAQLQGENGIIVDCRTIDHRVALCVPSPLGGVSKRRLSGGGGLELTHLRQLQRQTLLGDGGSVRLVVYREGLAPVALAAENGISQTEVHRPVTDTHLFYLVYHGSHCLFHFHAAELSAVDRVAALGVHTLAPCGGVAHSVFLYGHHLAYRQTEMFRKGEVAAVVGRHSHDGSRAVSRQHIVAHPDWYLLFG